MSLGLKDESINSFLKSSVNVNCLLFEVTNLLMVLLLFLPAHVFSPFVAKDRIVLEKESADLKVLVCQ